MNKKKITEKSGNKKSIKQIASEEKEKPVQQSSSGTKSGEKVKTRRVVSFVLPDKSPVDMLYDKKSSKTMFAVLRDGKITIEDSIQLNPGIILKPLSPNNGVVEDQFVLLPSAIEEYGSNEALYQEIEKFVDKYVYLPDEFRVVAVTYIMMSWLYDKFANIPYLRAVGIHGTGKTRFLEVVGQACYKPLLVGASASVSSVFRMLNDFRGTLIFDEADLGAIESREMLAILRQGFSSSFSVTRSDPNPNGGFFVAKFRVFGPKVLASRDRTTDVAFESRFITHQMYPVEDIKRPIALPETFKDDVSALMNKLLLFRFRHFHKEISDESIMGEIKLPRLKQAGIALMSVAKLIGEKQFATVLKFLKEYETELSIDQADCIEHDVLVCIFALLTEDEVRSSGKIRMEVNLAEQFNSRFYDDYSNRENREYRDKEGNVLGVKGYRVSGKKMGVVVRRMGIKSDRDSDGIYIPVYREYPRLVLLAKRYGVTKQFTTPPNPLDVVEVRSDEARASEVEIKVIEAELEANVTSKTVS